MGGGGRCLSKNGIDWIYDLEDFVSLLVDELIHLDGARRLLRQ
jgi:hypothetical protein